MTNYKVDSIYEIRKHLWTELVDNNILNIEDYYSDNIGEAIVPIIPVQQAPELNQFLSGKTHIVYDKIGMTYGDNWMVCDEKNIFTVYSTEYDEINEIRNLMIDVFRRMDESARDLNSSKDTNLIKFHNILVLEISPTAPSTELKGFLAADIIIEVKYSRIVDRAGRYL